MKKAEFYELRGWWVPINATILNALDMPYETLVLLSINDTQEA